MTFFFNLLTRDFLRRLSNHTPTLAAAEAEVGMRVAQRWNSTANLSNQSPTNAAVWPTCACYLGGRVMGVISSVPTDLTEEEIKTNVRGAQVNKVKRLTYQRWS